MRIRGRTYSSAEQLLEEIEQLEQMRDAELDELRGRGAHAAADKRADAYERELNELRAGVRKYREREASSTEQPPDTPRRSRRQLAGAARRRAKRPSSRRLFGGRATSRILRETGARGAYVSTTRVLLELAGMVIGIALLINLLESERGAGNRYSGLDTFTGLLERGVDALGRFIGPVDPFTGVDVTPAGRQHDPSRNPARKRPEEDLVRFPWSQVVKAVIGMAALIVILERAGGFSLILERGSGAFANAFQALTPAPGTGGRGSRAPTFTGALRPRTSRFV